MKYDVSSLFDRSFCRIVSVDDAKAAKDIENSVYESHPEYKVEINEAFCSKKVGPFTVKNKKPIWDILAKTKEVAEQTGEIGRTVGVEFLRRQMKRLKLDAYENRVSAALSNHQRERASILYDAMNSRFDFLLNECYFDPDKGGYAFNKDREHYLAVASWCDVYEGFEWAACNLIWITGMPLKELLELLGESASNSSFYAFFTLAGDKIVEYDKVKSGARNSNTESKVKIEPYTPEKIETIPPEDRGTKEPAPDVSEEVLAMGGYPDAQYRCGLFYYEKYKKSGNAEDRKMAYKWFGDAVVQGHDDAVEMIMKADFDEDRQHSRTEPDPIAEEKTAARNFGRELSSFRIGSIGHIDREKPTLGVAIEKTLEHFLGQTETNGCEKRSNGVCVQYSSENRVYSHMDWLHSKDCVKNMITGQYPMDGVILVVDGMAGITPSVKEQLTLAEKTGIPYLVVLADNCDLIDECDLDHLDGEIRSILDACGYPGDDTPIVWGSVGKAFEDPSGEWGEKLLELIEVVDEYFPDAEQDIEKSFVMPVEDSYFIVGRSMVAIGTIESGTVKVGDKLDIIGCDDEDHTVTVTGIELGKKLIDLAEAGQKVGVMLRGADMKMAQCGSVLAGAGKRKGYNHFNALIHFGSEERIINGLKLQFRIRTAEVTGTVSLVKESACPGKEYAEVYVLLEQSVAIERGLLFSVYAPDGNALGAGKVIEIL